MKKFRKLFSDHGLLLIFIFLFLAFLVGQTLSGLSMYNGTQAAHGLPAVGYWRYVRTGNFLEGVFANWQAAILQLGSLIIFGIFLRERGAAHSLKPGEPAKVGKSAQPDKPSGSWARHRHPAQAFSKSQKRSGGNKKSSSAKSPSWLYRNSLSIAFVVLFAAAFLLHLFSGVAAYNEHLALSRRAPLSAAQFFVSSKFWFETFQTWEAEYMAIALYIFLTIFLRQEGSPESKPVGSSNRDTGEVNK